MMLSRWTFTILSSDSLNITFIDSKLNFFSISLTKNRKSLLLKVNGVNYPKQLYWLVWVICSNTIWHHWSYSIWCDNPKFSRKLKSKFCGVRCIIKGFGFILGVLVNWSSSGWRSNADVVLLGRPRWRRIAKSGAEYWGGTTSEPSWIRANETCKHL